MGRPGSSGAFDFKGTHVSLDKSLQKCAPHSRAVMVWPQRSLASASELSEGVSCLFLSVEHLTQ